MCHNGKTDTNAIPLYTINGNLGIGRIIHMGGVILAGGKMPIGSKRAASREIDLEDVRLVELNHTDHLYITPLWILTLTGLIKGG